MAVLLLFQEFNKHDKEPSKYIKHWTGTKPKTGARYTCDIGYERFLGPEVFGFTKQSIQICSNFYFTIRVRLAIIGCSL